MTVWYLRHMDYEEDDTLFIGPVPEDRDIDEVLNSGHAEMWAQTGELTAISQEDLQASVAGMYVNPWSLWEESEQLHDAT